MTVSTETPTDNTVATEPTVTVGNHDSVESNTDRIVWLEKAYDAVRAQFVPNAPMYATITAGFTSQRGRKSSTGKYALAEAHSSIMSECTEAGRALIVVNLQTFDDHLKVIGTLIHECIHLCYPTDGHKGKFAEMAKNIGFDAPLVLYKPNDDLREKILELSRELPPMPAGFAEMGLAVKRQTTRNYKFECSCGVICRSGKLDFAATCDLCSTKFARKIKPESK